MLLFRFIFCLVFFHLLVIKTSGQTAGADTVIIVSKDGSGKFTSIQDAVNSVRDLSQKEVRIFIKKGVYHEKIRIPSWKTNIRLTGESRDSTIITHNDYSGKLLLAKDATGRDRISTYSSYTVLVEGNGCVLENLTIKNTAGRVGQAVALHVEGDRVTIKNCNILGNQDTLYAATENSRQYYESCFIEGTTDFIFGEATAVFQQCTIKSLSNSYITAAATSARQKFGFVFLYCNLAADTGASKVFLGRPWRPFAKTAFLYCKLGSHIVAEGWNAWKGDAMFPDKEKTAFYAEYKNTGDGANTSHRVAWAKQLSKKAAKAHNLQNIFSGWQPR